ncbi:TPA: Fic/DOC family protein [Streptococcus suis]
MARKAYEGYEYLDSENQYTYPNSSVLINKLGITDPIKAQRKEHLLVTKRLSDLRIKPIEIRSIKDVLAVHHYLFQDLYSWAGQYRTVNISKSGAAFMPIQSFGASEIFLNKLIENFHQSAHSRSEVIQQLAEILDNLNYYHPFREGNGRTQREVIRSLALSKGYRAQIRVEADDDIYHLYMDGTVQGDLEILKQLFDKILEKL